MKGTIKSYRFSRERAQKIKQLRALTGKKGAKTSRARPPLEVVVNELVHSVLDIRECEALYLKAARKTRESEVSRCKAQFDAVRQKLSQSAGVVAAQEHAEALAAIRQLRRASLSRADKVLQESLYNYLFSAFDFFVGDLLVALFRSRESLFKALDRTVKFQDLLETGDVAKVRKLVLDKEIESVRRESYADQFKWFETFFGIELRKWDQWPRFIEASQRRNLYVHCNGVVSEQYLSMCKQAGYKFKSEPRIGQRLVIEESYFNEATSLVMDAGVMLAHSLWRKVLPDELDSADRSLNDLIYEMLQAERWSDAERIAKFRIGQRKSSADLSNKMATINLVIAMKFGRNNSYRGVLEGVDWSSALPEFKLARHVLLDDFASAEKVMRQIGREGELITEAGYHSWPLFRDFRLSHQFLGAYNEIYGRPFKNAADALVADEAKSLQEETDSLARENAVIEDSE